MEPPPYSPIEAVTETLHGVAVTDPYRWLEDQESPRTREWLAAQTRYARAYLDSIPHREPIRQRIRELLDVEKCDSLQKVGNRYFFRKRLPEEEQPCIYMREAADGKDRLLLDPARRETGKYTALKPIKLSPDGQLLLYEVKQGGESTGTFELLEIASRRTVSDVLPRGYLRGFAFAPDSKSCYYVHDSLAAKRPFYRAAYCHTFGTSFEDDQEIFFAGEEQKLRLCLISDTTRLGFLVYRFGETIRTSFYVRDFKPSSIRAAISDANYIWAPQLTRGRIFAITNRNAPNFRIVELRMRGEQEPNWLDVVPEADAPIQDWRVAEDRIFVSYRMNAKPQISIFDFWGRKAAGVPVDPMETVRLTDGANESDEMFIESESFTQPAQFERCSLSTGQRTPWTQRTIPFDPSKYTYTQNSYPAKDGTEIPIFLVGRPDVLEGGRHPAIMTSYGGYGVSMTPQFSVFVTFLVERGCLFALPSIRGGSEFGREWHDAAKRRNRHVAFEDFLSAADWLVTTGRTQPKRLAIFGGSNSGLLVGAALTQRPDLFRAVVCLVPSLDMLRYHLFDSAYAGKEEFGTADDPDDFAALRGYSPYHAVREGISYPATMIVSGDADQNCNPMHARKMTARLQAANRSDHTIFLHYNRFRGHSASLPLSERIEALTDRMAFLCDQLQLPI